VTRAAVAGSVGNFLFRVNRRGGQVVEQGMNKPLSIALLVIGAILLFYGLKAGDSVGSDVSRAVTGTPTDRTVWFLVGGVLAGILGLFGLLRGTGSTK
jgi:hypothetical protein